MGRKDIAAGKLKQIKGKANDIAGAVTGNTGQQIKGTVQQAAGKVQETYGKATRGKQCVGDDRVSAIPSVARSFAAQAEAMKRVAKKRDVGAGEAKRVGDELGIDWTTVDLDQFRRGLEVELEHGARDPDTNVTNDDVILTGKIAWAHLKEFPDYYTRLARMEIEADGYWASRRRPGGVPRRNRSPKKTPAI